MMALDVLEARLALADNHAVCLGRTPRLPPPGQLPPDALSCAVVIRTTLRVRVRLLWAD